MPSKVLSFVRRGWVSNPLFLVPGSVFLYNQRMSKPIPAKPNLLSGVTPSGSPSLGNYIGAFRPFTAYLSTNNVFFMVADHHAITVRQDPVALRENTLGIAAWYIASGLNPAQCALFIQSHVSAHAELGWILGTFTQIGELDRMTQFKEKGRNSREAANAGLFTYPALMAADILLYQSAEVPVGDDQSQHLEIARTIATRFNNLYGETFVVPKAVLPKAGARVKDLQDPARKMSKSAPGPGTIMLLDAPAEAAKKIKRAVTDTENHIAYNPEKQPGIANLLEILGALSNRSAQQVAEEFAGQQYGALKNAVAEAVVFALEPLQARYAELMADKAGLQTILRTGAEKAGEVANATLARVMDKVGYLPR